MRVLIQGKWLSHWNIFTGQKSIYEYYNHILSQIYYGFGIFMDSIINIYLASFLILIFLLFKEIYLK